MNVRFEEPDFLFDYMGETYAVAVKRITSKRKVKERTREAEKQILRYEYDGFIAISLDRLLDFENPFVFLRDIEVLNIATQDILFTLVRENFNQNLFSERDDRVKGIFLTLGIPSFHPDNLGIGYGFNLQLFPLANPDENKMEFDRIGKITEQLLIMGLR